MLRFPVGNWRIRLTRPGAMTGLISCWLLAASLQAQVNLLLVFFGLGAGAMLAGLVLPIRGLMGLEIRRVLPGRVMRGDRVQVVYRMSRRRGRSFGLEIREENVRDALLQAAPRAWVPWVGAGEDVQAAWGGLAPERGEVRFDRMAVSTRFPFGLWEVSRRFDQPDGLLVLPRTDRPGVGRDEGGPADRTPRRQPYRSKHGEEVFAGLRDYRQGEDLRRIHWKATARRGLLVARDMKNESAAGLSVWLDLRQPVSPEACEQAIDEAATRLARAHAMGRPIRLRITGAKENIDPIRGGQTLAKCLEILCRVEVSAENGATGHEKTDESSEGWCVVRPRPRARKGVA